MITKPSVEQFIKKEEFPLDVFPACIAESFEEVARARDIPVQFLGTTALFTIASLSGNIYKTIIDQTTKPMIYAMLVAPSGVGKSPSYSALVEDVILSEEIIEHQKYQSELKDWKDRQGEAKAKKYSFTEPPPLQVIRMAKNGTREGIQKKCIYCAAGFGLYYDEGKTMLSGPDSYKKSNSSVDFFNTLWNGGSTRELRADDEREIFIYNQRISLLIGMQPENLGDYFTEKNVSSGLAARFLITTSDYIPLNDDFDPFSENIKPCKQWNSLVLSLFRTGMRFTKDSKSLALPFSLKAQQAYKALGKRLKQESTRNIKERLSGSAREVMLAYDGKLFQYVGRFLSILAIIDGVDNEGFPEITERQVESAEKLYWYFRAQAERILCGLSDASKSGMNEKQQLLYNLLPDSFSTAQAIEVCKSLRIEPRFFDDNFRRTYCRGYIKRVGKGCYEKI